MSLCWHGFCHPTDSIMARPLRVDVPGGIYHVTARGLERREIVRDAVDRQKWTEFLGQVATRRDWRVYAWALMDNHYHLFLRVPSADLSQGMHDLNASYVSVFNRRHRRCGPLFQGRFKGILVEVEYHYWELTRYVHLNPVRAGLAKNPEEYPWSSCAFYFGRPMPPRWLASGEILGEYGKSSEVAKDAYRRFLYEGLAKGHPSPLHEVVASTLLGSPTFIELMKVRLQDRLPQREVPAARRLQISPGVDEVIQAVCTHLGVDKVCLMRKGARNDSSRAIAMYLCRHLTNCAVHDLGRYFGGVNGQAVSNAVSKVYQKRKYDVVLDRQLQAIEFFLESKCRMTT